MSGDEIPSRFIPDGIQVIHKDDVCPGCGNEVPRAPYGKIESGGEWWHATCAFDESDAIETTDAALFCPNCRAYAEWHPVDKPDDVRRCPQCLALFRGGRNP